MSVSEAWEVRERIREATFRSPLAVFEHSPGFYDAMFQNTIFTLRTIEEGTEPYMGVIPRRNRGNGIRLHNEGRHDSLAGM